jgi:hypothetical protein
MKNPFDSKKPIPGTVKFSPPKSGINLPFSESEDTNSQANKPNIQSEDKKTRIGRQSDIPLGPKNDNYGPSCPQCDYPLRTEPSSSSPCPNCGFTGNAEKHITTSDGKKTISLDKLLLTEETELSSFKFKMIAESTGTEIKIESEEPEIILNRNHLAPENKSISSDQHILMKFRNGKIYMQDVSSNGSTFIQIIDRTTINPDTRIFIGNRIYLFTTKNSGQPIGDSKATRKFGEFSFDSNENLVFLLIEEGSGTKISLIQGINNLNRSSLDPGNASISGNKHAILEYINGQWFLSDYSSNKATFIQLKSEFQLVNKIKVILGNIIFRFEYN